MGKIVKTTITRNLIIPIDLKGQRYPEDSATVQIATRDETPETQTPWPSQFLRERIETMPILRRDIEGRGVEVEAAGFFDDLHTAISLLPVVKAGLDYLNRDHIENIRNIEEVTSKIDILWDSDTLLSLDCKTDSFSSNEINEKIRAKRKNALEKIKNSSISDPEELTWQMERALRDLLLMVRRSPDPTITIQKIQAESALQFLISICLNILTAMYQREDIGQCSLKTNKNSYHGWQYNRQNLKTIGDDLSVESSWYGCNDAPKLFSKILEDRRTDKGKNKLIDISFVEEIARRLEDILVSNWDVPIIYKVPPNDAPANYREYMYRALLRTTNDSSDPLFLKTPLSKVPLSLRPKVIELRSSIFKNETNIPSTDKDWHSSPLYCLARETSTEGIQNPPLPKTIEVRELFLHKIEADFKKD